MKIRFGAAALAACLLLALVACGQRAAPASSEVGIPSEKAEPPKGYVEPASSSPAPASASAPAPTATGGKEAVALLPAGEEDWQFQAVTEGVPVPDFLPEDQQLLYQAAYYMYYHFSLAGGFAPDMDAKPVRDEAYGEIDYYPDRGFASYADFEAALDAVFTPEFKQSLLNFPMYLNEDGKLYSATGARGANIYYQGEHFEQGTMADERIEFTLVGEYSSEEGEQPIPITLIKTDAGWRFDAFGMAL